MKDGPPVAGTLGGAESSPDQKQSAAGAVNRESVRTGPKARRAKRGPLDSAAALCSQYSRCPAGRGRAAPCSPYPLAVQPRRDDPVGLQPQPKALAVL